MSVRAFLCLGLAIAVISAWAGAAAKESAVAFFEKAGLREQLDAARKLEIEQAKEIARQMAAQMRAQLPDLPPAALQEVEKMTGDMVDAMAGAYTTQELLEVYAAPFDRAYPDGFAGEAEAFATPEGQRFIATLNEAIAATYAFRSQRQQAVINRETQKFVERLRGMVAPRQP
jgi:hypothetical protein